MKINKTDKVFLAYAWTGEDEHLVKERIFGILEFFESEGINAYCNLDDPKAQEFERPGQYVNDAIDKIKTRDVVVVIKTSERTSEGQLLEVGAALALEKPILLMLNNEAEGTTYLNDNEISVKTLMWSDESDLMLKLKEIV